MRQRAIWEINCHNMLIQIKSFFFFFFFIIIIFVAHIKYRAAGAGKFTLLVFKREVIKKMIQTASNVCIVTIKLSLQQIQEVHPLLAIHFHLSSPKKQWMGK